MGRWLFCGLGLARNRQGSHPLGSHCSTGPCLCCSSAAPEREENQRLGESRGPNSQRRGKPKFADVCVCRGSVQLDTGAALAVPTPRPRSRRTAPHRGAGSAQPMPGADAPGLRNGTHFDSSLIPVSLVTTPLAIAQHTVYARVRAVGSAQLGRHNILRRIRETHSREVVTSCRAARIWKDPRKRLFLTLPWPPPLILFLAHCTTRTPLS